MEITALITIFGVFIANAAMVLPLFLWVRAESRADERHTDAKLEATRDLVRAIHGEVRNFNERLLEIQKK